MDKMVDEQFPSALLEQARQVKILFLDVDGVLTDGSIYFSEQGETLKRFHTLDGHGMKLVQQAGVTLAVISGRDSSGLRCRFDQLGVVHRALGTEEKRTAAEQILQTLNLTWNEAAAMGDDWPDLPLLRRAKLACAPASAHHEVLKMVHYVARAPAGFGAVRELCDLLLAASGRYTQLMAKYEQ